MFQSKDMEQSVILPATADGQVLSVVIKEEIDIEEQNLDDIKQEIDEEKVMIIKQEYIDTDNMQGDCSSTISNCNIDTPSTSVTIPSDNFGITTMKKTDSALVIELKKQVRVLATKDRLKSKQIRRLQKANWTQKQKISRLFSTIRALQKKYSVHQEHVVEILRKFETSDDLVDQFLDEDGN